MKVGQILIIGTDDLLLGEINIYFKSVGSKYHVDIATNVREGINKIDKESYDLIIIELDSSAIKENELLSAIKERVNRIPNIIVIKGEDENIESENWMEMDKVICILPRNNVINNLYKIIEINFRNIELEEKLNRSRRILKNLPGGFFQSDINNRLIKCDLAYANLFGYENFNEILNSDIVKISHKSPLDHEKYIKKLHKDGFVVNYPIRAITLSQEEIYIAVNSWVILDVNGNIIGREGFLRDISKVHYHFLVKSINNSMNISENLKKLRRKNNLAYLLYKALKDSEDGVLITDRNGIIIYANKAQTEMHGYSKKFLIGKQSGIFNPHPGIPRVKKLLSEDLDENFTYGGEIQNLTANNKLIPIELTLFHIHDFNNQFIGRIGIAKNIAEKNKIREKMELAFHALEASEDGIMITEQTTGEIKYVNPAQATMHGYESKSELLEIIKERNYIGADIFNPTRKARIEGLSNFEEKRKGTIEFKGIINNAMKDEKQLLPVFLTLSLVKNIKGENIGRIGIAKDMTRYRKIEEIQKMALKQVEPKKMFETIFSDLKEIIKFETKYIILFDWKKDRSSTYTLFSDIIKTEKVLEEHLIPEQSITGWINTNKNHFISHNIQDDKRTRLSQKTSTDEEKKLISIIGSPIFDIDDPENLKGHIILGSYKENAFNDKDLYLLSNLSNHLSIALKNAEIHGLNEKVLDNNPDAIIIVGYKTEKHGIISYINKEAQRLFGISKKDILNSTIEQFYWRGRNEANDILKKMKQEKGYIRNYYTNLKDVDGNKIPIILSGMILRDFKGNAYATMGIIRDYREQLALKEEREKLLLKTFHKSKLESIGELAAGVAHQIKNPLQSILLNIENVNHLIRP